MPLSYREEQQLYGELSRFEARRSNYERAASADLAQIVEQLSNGSPYASANVVLPAAQAVRDGRMTSDQALDFLDSATRVEIEDASQGQAEEADNRSPFKRVIDGFQDAAKKTVKWGVAGLEFVPQVVTNLASRVYMSADRPAGEQASWEQQDPNDFIGKPTTDAFDLGALWASTDLGALFSGAKSGSGYFIGEEAKQQQIDAAEAYRGTIGGEAFTLGKGTALIFSQPGSRAFNIASGLVDASVALAVPSIPGSKIIGRQASLEAAKRGARTTAGLTNFAEPYVQPQKVKDFLMTAGGQRIVTDLAKSVNTISDARRTFPNADFKWWNDIAKTESADDVMKLLADPVRGLGLGEGLQDVRNINVGWATRMRDGKSLNYSRLFAPRAGREFMLETTDPNDFSSATRTIVNAEAYMRTVRADQKDINDVLNKMAEGFDTRNRAIVDESINDVRNILIDKISTEGARKKNREFVEGLFKRYDEHMKEFRSFSLYGATDAGSGAAKVHKGLMAKIPGVEGLATDVAAEGIAQLATEVAKFSTYMPDIRKIRRATSKYEYLFAPKARLAAEIGDPYKLETALDFVLNQVWRPSTLLTGGYRLRNMIESMFIRMPTVRGIDSGPTHPFEWGMILANRKFLGDIDGLEWTENAQRFATRGRNMYREATNNVPREVMSDQGLQEIAHRAGYYSLAKKAPKADGSFEGDYVRGVANELRLLAGDPIARALARGKVGNDEFKSLDEFIEMMTETDWGKAAIEDLNVRHRNIVLDYNGQKTRGDIVYSFVDENGVTQYTPSLNTYIADVQERLMSVTTGNPTLRDIVGNADEYGKFTTFDGRQVSAFQRSASGADPTNQFEVFDYTQDLFDEVSHWLGVEKAAKEAGTPLMAEFPEYVKFTKPIDAHDIPGLGNRASWWRQTTNHFFSYVFGKPEAFLNRSPLFRAGYYRKLDDLVKADLLSREAYDYAVTNIQRAVRETGERKLRMLKQMKPDAKGMYEWDGTMIGKTKYERLVSKAEREVADADRYIKIRKVVDPTTGRTSEVYDILPEFDKYGARYVGSEELWRTIKERAASPSTTTEGLTGEQASFVAKAFAMEQTKTAFYNASETSNFADIMRIIVPFGPAWNEAMRFYIRELAMQPERIKKTAVTVQGFRDMDPDNDGKGFIYQDPVTGEMVFNYPFSGAMLPLLSAFAGSTLTQTFTRGGAREAALGAIGGAALGYAGQKSAENALQGLDITLQAPAQSLSQSFQVLPGFGPAVQFSATQILGDRPEFDDFMSVVAPFGSFSSVASAALPSWAQKVVQAISGDPDNDRFFADFYIDAYRALYATGEYDNTSPESMQTLRQNARSAARTLLALRGIGQFTGPARPDLEIRVPTKFQGEVTVNDIKQMVDGNINSSLLAATFRQMQEDDYENAVQNFLRTFGADAMLYLPGLSNTEVKGLQATDVFGDWERNNRDLTEKFPTVYGYFAPSGGEFELQTYLRQIREKKRRKISDPQELQRDAEAVVGRALYMDAVRMAGIEPSDAAERQLREYKAELEKRLPGFATAPLNINEREQVMLEIRNAAQDAELNGNPVAEASRIYFQYREEALQEAARRTGEYKDTALGLKANGDLRQWMRKVGEALMDQYPEFQRIYARVLFDEVDY